MRPKEQNSYFLEDDFNYLDYILVICGDIVHT
jgi:hypothetical protein